MQTVYLMMMHDAVLVALLLPPHTAHILSATLTLELTASATLCLCIMHSNGFPALKMGLEEGGFCCRECRCLHLQSSVCR
uniref:Putative secreted protein n=1 Tax=Anopheles darlingi TaxID=43151 RepID=A0A2M4D4Q6_ANODA